jgi:hypothetical protein
MARGRQPDPEHVRPGRDREESEDPRGITEGGGHAGAETDQLDHLGHAQHDEPGRRDDEQRP